MTPIDPAAPLLSTPPRGTRELPGTSLRAREGRHGSHAKIAEVDGESSEGHRLHRQPKRRVLTTSPLGSRYSTSKIVQGWFVDSLRCARNFANVRPEPSESE